MPLKILIVDDNREAAELFQELLEMSGHDVRCAYDAHQALAAATASPAQVYLLDLTLPDMHGTELAQQLRPLSAPQRPLVIAVTGLAADAAPAGEGALFDHFLQKPVDFARLERILADAEAAA